MAYQTVNLMNNSIARNFIPSPGVHTVYIPHGQYLLPVSLFSSPNGCDSAFSPPNTACKLDLFNQLIFSAQIPQQPASIPHEALIQSVPSTTTICATDVSAGVQPAADAGKRAPAEPSAISSKGSAWKKVYSKLCQNKITPKLESVLREKGLRIKDLEHMDLAALRQIWRITHRRWHSSHRCIKYKDHPADAGENRELNIQEKLEGVLREQSC